MTETLREPSAAGTDPAIGAIEAAFDAVVVATTRARHHSEVLARAGVDLDRAGATLLRLLAGCPSELRLRDLAEEVGVEPSGVTRKVQQLEQKGLVSRCADPADGRAYRLSLTAEGRHAIEALLCARQEALGRLLADWPPADRTTFARLLRQFAASMTAREVGE